jgi:hypothetical protein
VKRNEKSVYDYAHYVPVGNAVEKLKNWQKQGAVIIYLSSHRTLPNIKKDERVLQAYHFPLGKVFYRKRHESYNEVAERAIPDVLIEDDCESIGGEVEMTYPHIGPEIKKKITSVVVKEFEGIDHLPDNITDLKTSSR